MNFTLIGFGQRIAFYILDETNTILARLWGLSMADFSMFSSFLACSGLDEKGFGVLLGTFGNLLVYLWTRLGFCSALLADLVVPIGGL